MRLTRERRAISSFAACAQRERRAVAQRRERRASSPAAGATAFRRGRAARRATAAAGRPRGAACRCQRRSAASTPARAPTSRPDARAANRSADQAAERDAADRRALETAVAHHGRDLIDVVVEAARLVERQARGALAGERERDHAEARGQRVDRRPHVLPPALQAGISTSGGPFPRSISSTNPQILNPQILSSSAACRSSACAGCARASCARRTASGTPRARGRAGTARSTVVWCGSAPPARMLASARPTTAS